MKIVIALLVLVVAAGGMLGCSSCNPCNDCNPCEPCVAAPVYQSPCCPAPTGGVDGNWGGGAPAMAPSGCGPCGY